MFVRKRAILEGPRTGWAVGTIGGFRLNVFDRKLRDLLCRELLAVDAIPK